MEKVKVIKEFRDIKTGKLYKVNDVIDMPKERVTKQIMLGLVKRVEQETKQEAKQETKNKEKTEEIKK